MNYAIYIDYPVPALLYDAERGNTYSRLLIFDYFANLTEANQDIPRDIQVFIAKQLRSVINEKQTPEKMFYPRGKNRHIYNPLIDDLVRGSKEKWEVKYKETASKIYGNPERWKAVEKQHQIYKKYTGRLSKIQALLDEMKTSPSRDRATKIAKSLRKLTASP